MKPKNKKKRKKSEKKPTKQLNYDVVADSAVIDEAFAAYLDDPAHYFTDINEFLETVVRELDIQQQTTNSIRIEMDNQL